MRDLPIDDLLGKKEARKMSRYCQLAMIAAKEAYQDSGLEHARPEDPYRFGVIVSSGVGGMDAMETEHIKAMEKGYDRLVPVFRDGNYPIWAPDILRLPLAPGGCVRVWSRLAPAGQMR